jgi:hypothetical protein
MPNPFVFNIKAGDTKTPVQAQLISSVTKSAIDLTNVSSAKFLMSEVGDDSVVTPLVDASATITEATEGKLEYQWTAGDTLIEGTHLARFLLTWNDGTLESIPARGYIEIRIEALS